MRVFGALVRVWVNAVYYACGGAVYGLVNGAIAGVVIVFFLALPLMFGDSGAFAALAGGLAWGAIWGGVTGCVGGFAAFAFAGVVQGISVEFAPKTSLDMHARFDKCLLAALWAAALCAGGGAVTGACASVLSWWLNGRGLVVSELAAFGGAAGYVFGLFLGALWPGVVEKARERWRVWYENWRAAGAKADLKP